MKNVMLPTDFSVQSLWPIHNIVRNAGNQKLCIQVVHMLGLPTDITDLLWIRSSKPYSEIPQHFHEAFQLMFNRYRHVIEKMSVRFIHGSTGAVLNSHIESCGFEEVYVLANYNYTKPFHNSINCASLLQRCCKVPLYPLPLHNEAFSEYQILSALLAGNEQNEMPETGHLSQPMISFS